MTSSIITGSPAAPGVFIPADRPADFAARAYARYVTTAATDERREFGQFFTPVTVARFMAKLSAIDGRSHLRIVEPGAGTAVLTAALSEALPASVDSVHIDAFEIHPTLAVLAEEVLDYTAGWMTERGRKCTFEVHRSDFILSNADALTSNLFSSPRDLYDIAIANPPYFKLKKEDIRARAAAHIVHGQPNIYAIFMAIMASLLRDDGVMVTITPRSFTTGEYFRRFREVLFASVVPEAVHLFTSRRDAFREDEVLQENVIVRARKSRAKKRACVSITSSAGVYDLEQHITRRVPLERVIDFHSRDLAVHVPTSAVDDEVLELVRSWPETLTSLGLMVSTGPVVAFRAEEFLRHERNHEDLAPLLWLQNVRPMQIIWPIAPTNKRQYIIESEESHCLLVPSQNCVVMRRFSAKEEHRRIIAAPLIDGMLPGRMIGLENHLNYVHRPKRKMTADEVAGVAALLNSGLVDRYFRISNGNTQVSAAELRHLPLPDANLIAAIGRAIRGCRGETLDRIVDDALNVPARVRRELERGVDVEGR